MLKMGMGHSREFLEKMIIHRVKYPAENWSD
jgi:hypothetical protein